MAKAKEQSEEEAIERFRNFLGLERKTAFAITGRDVEVNSVTHENFDYQLQSQDGAKIAVELFRLIESGEELARQKVFSEFVEKLKTGSKVEIDEKNLNASFPAPQVASK